MRFVEIINKKKFTLISIFLFLYVMLNLFDGERGLISYYEKQKTIEYARQLGWNQPDGTPNVRGSDWARLDAKSPLDFRRSVLDSGNGHRNDSGFRQAADTAYRRTASGRCGAATECESYGFVTELTAP
mgnify:CR=1 FL=1